MFERRRPSATEPRGSARPPHVLRTRTPRPGRQRQAVPAARPDKSPPPPSCQGQNSENKWGSSCPLLAGLDLSALIREAAPGPESSQSPEAFPNICSSPETCAGTCTEEENVCCLFGVSLAPFQPFSLIQRTFACACKSAVPII